MDRRTCSARMPLLETKVIVSCCELALADLQYFVGKKEVKNYLDVTDLRIRETSISQSVEKTAKQLLDA